MYRQRDREESGLKEHGLIYIPKGRRALPALWRLVELSLFCLTALALARDDAVPGQVQLYYMYMYTRSVSGRATHTRSIPILSPFEYYIKAKFENRRRSRVVEASVEAKNRGGCFLSKRFRASRGSSFIH